MINFFAQNLKYLRKEKGLTQEEFALKIGINRPKVGSYEEGRAEPNLETLQNISHFFKVKLDDLLERNLKKTGKKATKDIEGNDLRILPIVVNEAQEEKITLVPIKAAAGYLNGYADPEYVEELPRFNLPFQLIGQGTFRAFQIQGDSMSPLNSGSYILTRYLDNWNWVKDGACYVVVSKEEGVVYKRLINKLKQEVLELHSDNPLYDTYTVSSDQVLEVWEAVGYISFELPAPSNNPSSVEELSEMMLHLRKEVDVLKKKSK